jgi:hypothetical protein
MEAKDKYLPQQVLDENFAINSFMEQMVKEIEQIQAEREAAYQKAMQPLPEDDDE